MSRRTGPTTIIYVVCVDSKKGPNVRPMVLESY